ncbi:MAG: type II secretion system F family protein [Candidatus Peregrinibacteria bacterium]
MAKNEKPKARKHSSRAAKRTEPEPLSRQPPPPEEKKDAPPAKQEKRGFLSWLGKAAPSGDAQKQPPGGSSPVGGFGAFLRSINNLGMGRQAALFVQSTAMMLNAGLPILDALKIFELEARGRSVKKLAQRMIASVESGSPLWRAMQEQCLFPPYDISMVRIGEDAGNLARNMEYLSEQREKDRALRSKVKMAMIYPAVVLVLMFVLIMGLGLFVLPNLVGVLVSLNVKLPLMTQIVIWVANAFSAQGKIFVPASFGFLVLFALLAKFTRFKVVVQWLVFRLPGIGRLAREATIARFGVILGGLLQAGVPLVESMESLVHVTTVVAYQDFYTELLKHVQVGDSFAKAFEELKESKNLFPISVQQLVVTGERSGALSESLLRIATMYDRKAEETAQVLPVILEPVLLLCIGALVGAIAFAIIIPIYSVVGGINSA